ncbi:hypothetical protein BDB01DRAFT_902710 [Pilobolus umbonatus]|nr:hypothetical protein BDB01DRAFT_902710 [Pilobolus umbonatus]
MEAIDEYANENIARSIAYTALEHRQQHDYLGLIPVSSKLLRQRLHYLGYNNENTPKQWDKVVQWQEDNCPAMIESLWASGGSVADEFYQRPVYYKRVDAETLEAIIEFAEKNTQHYAVILVLEEGSGDISDIKYHNTKEYTEKEWLDIFENWSRALEDAERIYLTKVTRHRSKFQTGSHEGGRSKEVLDDYWGEWSSDEGSSRDSRSGGQRPHPLRDDLKESDDSEDDYYSRWSKNPGTLTPGLDEMQPKSGRVLQPLSALRQEDITLQQEMDEEYDQSYNPLFTVPSVPNLIDAHTAALSELTQMLQTSLPQQPRSQVPSQINPLPKAVSRLRSNMEDLNINSEESSSDSKKILPGAYPESGTHTPLKDNPIDLNNVKKEEGRGLFMKSLEALIGAARLMGYEGKDILEMVRDIVNKPQ